MREEQQAGGGRQRNARSNGPSDNAGMGSEEKVRYVNKELNPDHEVHDSD